MKTWRATLFLATLCCSLTLLTNCQPPNEPDRSIDPDPVNFGNALRLDGTRDYIVVPHDTDLTLSGRSFTIETWVRPANYTYYAWIVAKAASNESLDYLLGFDSDGRVRFITRSLANDLTATLPKAYRWYHLAAVQDVQNGSVSLYIDGKLQATTVLRGKPNNNSADLILGARILPGNQQMLTEHLDADIDEIRIWNKALSRNEINERYYKTLQGSEDGLVAYWNFDEEDGDVVLDAAGNNHGGNFGVASSPIRIPSTIIE